MPLAALIIVDGAAEPLILGRSATEIIMRRTRSCGADHLVLLVERVSQSLLASVDRLRRDGATVDLARTVTDAAERFHPEERVLLMAKGHLLEVGLLRALASSHVPTVLAIDNAPSNAAFELIDASARWTGFALLDGATLRQTAAMVGDWDFGSTLLRQIIAAGAARIMLDAPDAARDLVNPTGVTGGRVLASQLLQSVDVAAKGAGDALVVRPVARLLAGVAGEKGVAGHMLASGGLVLATLALGGAAYGWIVTPLVLLLIALVAIATGHMLDAATSGRSRTTDFRSKLLPLIEAAIAIAIAWSFWGSTGQWGYVVLALVIIMSLALAEAGAAPRRALLADPPALAAFVLLGATIGVAGAAAALACAYAVGSLLWLNRTSWQKAGTDQA